MGALPDEHPYTSSNDFEGVRLMFNPRCQPRPHHPKFEGLGKARLGKLPRNLDPAYPRVRCRPRKCVFPEQPICVSQARRHSCHGPQWIETRKDNEGERESSPPPHDNNLRHTRHALAARHRTAPSQAQRRTPTVFPAAPRGSGDPAHSKVRPTAAAHDLLDLIFLKDMVMQLFLKVMVRDATKGGGTAWLREPQLIRRRYLRGWFTIDLLSILPFDVLGLVFQHKSVQQLKVELFHWTGLSVLLNPNIRQASNLPAVVRQPHVFRVWCSYNGVGAQTHS